MMVCWDLHRTYDFVVVVVVDLTDRTLFFLGSITSLKNVKKDVTEMRKGTECGIGFDGWEGFEVGDQVQTYEVISEKRKL